MNERMNASWVIIIIIWLIALHHHQPVFGKKFVGERVRDFRQDSEISITLSLKLNDKSGLDQLLSDLYDPTSSRYGQYLTTDEFVKQYSPSDDQVSSVTDFLANYSVQVTKIDRNRILLHAKGSVGSVSNAFQTVLGLYDDEGLEFFQPDTEPILPENLSVLNGVHGLHNRTKRRHHSKVTGKSIPLSVLTSSFEQDLTYFIPSTIHDAYQVGSKYQGNGQIAALAEFDTYEASDIASYASTFDIRQVPLQNVLINAGGEDAPTTPGGGQTEVTLDIELMNAMAPGLDMIMVYIGPNSNAGTLAVYSQIANENLASVVSTSWGLAESELDASDISAESTIFEQMSAQGQSMFAAAGDSGAYDAGGDTSPAVDDPASQPYVSGVGGTSLSASSAGAYISESVWLTSKSKKGVEGGGGGVSSVHRLPSYQVGVISAASEGSTSFRNVPDVALNSDPNVGYLIVVTPPGQAPSQYGVEVGGTSCASPLFASFIALVNQALAENNKPRLGFANYALYQLGKSSNYNSLFHDITTGNNGLYPAVKGYDDSTGWGSFIGDPLLAALVGLTTTTTTSTAAPAASPPSQSPQSKKSPTTAPGTGGNNLGSSSTGVSSLSISASAWILIATLQVWLLM